MLNVNMDKHPHRINERRMVSLKTEGRAEWGEAWSIRIAPFNSWVFCWAPHDPASVTWPKEAAKPRHAHRLLKETRYSMSLWMTKTKAVREQKAKEGIMLYTAVYTAYVSQQGWPCWETCHWMMHTSTSLLYKVYSPCYITPYVSHFYQWEKYVSLVLLLILSIA